ncbi:uncharacterized protein EI97DRAFT_454083 [Westerdykella ornata]|uniref:RhoGAP-domain-containing protein n=1 Tax=Westerdykella ornata TaxID=318751 RepID=A0A6A6JW63_WESOR|nr:uncharacterized protein EI97DRAFT_454083 [Westerdykella ornata]KAF2280842.1 hypothetical protein EI97DRAFT_454083 [Westerdykella ornata]
MLRQHQHQHQHHQRGRMDSASSTHSTPSDSSESSPSSTTYTNSSLHESTRPRGLPPSPIEVRSAALPRKPIPSPLQQSSLYSSVDTSDDTAIGSPRSPKFSQPSYHDGPRSPREKLDAFLAEEDRPLSPASTPTPTPSTSNTHPSSRLVAAHRAGTTQPVQLSSHAQPRNVSAPVLSSATVSPPSSPAAMPPPSRPSRPDTHPTAPRNHSIDSQVSSLSSTSQNYRANAGHQPRPSQDAAPSQPPDMASLIAAAGSPEAALLAMWKEKQSASNHNAQLWRLVEKQRAMILGLNKDLERALKDKDRYRKKLKDYVNQVPPVPGAPKRTDTFDSAVERGETPSPAPSERQDDSAQTQPAARGVEHKTSPLIQGSTASQTSDGTQMPSQSEGAGPVPASSTEPPTRELPSPPPDTAHAGLGLGTIGENTEPQADSTTPTESPVQQEPGASTKSADALKAPAISLAQAAPALSLTQATPVLGGDGFDTPTKPSHTLRKAPPAPLNLSKPSKTSAHLYQPPPGEQSDDDDDYDDTLEVDEIPIVERGRRKTREEDDRVREAMMMKDEEARSKSKKKKSESKNKSKAATEEPVEESEQAKSATASLSPRMFSPQMSGLPLSPRHPPAHSLNALLSPTNSDSSMMANRSVSSISSPLMSPGLPTSPRPGDRPLGSPLPRNPRQGLASPPMSPRSGVNGIAPRPPRQPIPLPPNTPQSYTSPQVIKEQQNQVKQQVSSSDLLRPPNAQPSPGMDHTQGETNSEFIYRGLVSDQYPGLLLPPNALPSIDVKVFSSRLRPSRLSFLAPKPQEEDPVFILAIYARSDGKQLWRVEKTIMALPALDSQLKSLCEFAGKLPDRALFSGHAPAKMDARRAALNTYFDMMLETPMSEKAALVVCEFFSTDVIGAQNDDALAPEPAAAQNTAGPKPKQRKEGYLTKRGKNFGGWKARYFVLDGPEFRYYEQAGGAHLGTIKLQNAQIGKQSQQQTNQSPQRRDDSEDNQYRHAFLILEPKRKDSSSLVRHVLCAESDAERDAWVDALLQHVDWQEEHSPTEAQPAAARNTQSKSHGHDQQHANRKDSPEVNKADKVQGLSYEDTVAAEAPIRGPPLQSHASSPKTSSFSESGHLPTISGPTNGAPIQNAESWGNKLAAPTSVKDKKRSIFGFRGRVSSDLAPVQAANQQSQQQVLDRGPQQSRNIFGIPLQEAVDYSQPIGVNVQLPSVVYRCLEYLKVKKAYQEEGIFRLSGSNIVIKGLRDRFNNEGDVKLLSGEYYDVHAVASLLKLYLRELPSSILTRELHIDFLKVLDMDERTKKIQTFNVLVHKLPRVNFELLQAMSSFLIQIVDNAAQNKMTVRNVGIVFAPTLNIPAPLISMFLTDFPEIFGMPVDETSSPIHEIHVTTPPLGDEAIRSPRHQMFSDLPTPAYNQTSFQSQDRPPVFPMGASHASSLQPPPHQQSHASYDTGFIPLRPSYDAPMYEQHYQGDGGYGSLTASLQPNSGNSKEARQARRESGMLLMNMGMQNPPRKGSNPRMRIDEERNPRMVREETAFD